MRTQDEIFAEANRLFESKTEDVFGFSVGDLVECLPFALAKKWLKDEVTAEQFAKEMEKSAEPEAVKARMLDYMMFAWEKAHDCRGLSAMRSLMHMRAWLWLLGEDEACKSLGEYTHYGKPLLREICEHFGWRWRLWDSGEWREDEDRLGVGPNAVPAVRLPWKAAA